MWNYIAIILYNNVSKIILICRNLQLKENRIVAVKPIPKTLLYTKYGDDDNWSSASSITKSDRWVESESMSRSLNCGSRIVSYIKHKDFLDHAHENYIHWSWYSWNTVSLVHCLNHVRFTSHHTIKCLFNQSIAAPRTNPKV